MKDKTNKVMGTISMKIFHLEKREQELDKNKHEKPASKRQNTYV